MAINRNLDEPLSQAVVDYVAGMTDRFATQVFQDIYVPRTWGL
jgi:dGTPase